MTTARRDAAARHIRQLNDQIQNSPDEIAAMDVHTIELRLEILRGHWATFQTEHLGLAELSANDDAREVQDQLFSQVQLHYIAVGARYRAMIAAHRRDVARERQPPPGDAEPNNGNVVGAAQAAAHLRFDKVTMKKFDGDYRNWRAFRDQYQTMVHNNGQLDDATKFYFLLQFLDTEPARVIAGIAQTATNYAGAWNALNDRYENVRVLIDAHFKRFFGLETMQKENAEKLLKMVDTTNELTRSLPGLDVDVTSWDPILLYCLVLRLDATTKRAWDLEVRDTQHPTISAFLTFLTSRARSIDSSDLSGSPRTNFGRSFTNKRASAHAAIASTANGQIGCRMCKGAHPLYRCAEFKALTPKVRHGKAQNWKICFKCLGNHSFTEPCALGPCPTCGKPHNKLLCFSTRENSEVNASTQQAATPAIVNSVLMTESNQSVSDVQSNSRVCYNVGAQFYDTSMLGTIQLRILNCENNTMSLRALCDSGAQLSLITEHSVQALGLYREKSDVTLTGVGGVDVGRTFGIVKARIAPANSPDYCSFEVKFYVLKKLTTIIPSAPVDVAQWSHLDRLNLADKTCGVPSGIDILLGVDIWSRIIKRGIIHQQDGSPTAQQTSFGWVLFGTTVQSTKPQRNIVATTTCNTSNEQLDSNMERFWLSEETLLRPIRTQQAELCEQLFQKSFSRNEEGRYVVKLPFNEKVNDIGDSRQSAVQQFKRLEQNLLRNDLKRQHYIAFMNDYETLGHMSPVPNISKNERGYFIPHHAVQTSEKFRVVFNASHPSSTGVSLNDAQIVGEKLQCDLVVTIMRFRTHRIALTADVSKMYRQILVDVSHRNYQRIVWRSHPSQELQEFQLNTVTYGQAAAPHCAIRAMQQCARDYADQFPIGAAVVLSAFYVDDMLAGGDSVESVEQIYSETTQLLAKGKFELRKWCSNNWNVLTTIQREDTVNEISLNTAEEESTSVLGLKWSPASDSFFFKIKPIDLTQQLTKRMVVGQISRLYDPNGYLSATIIVAKVIIQKLWKCNIDWDDQVPNDILVEWKHFAEALPQLETIRIPRWLGTSPCYAIELHGFCDASQTAFGAVIFARVTQPSGQITVNLITAKTKVAPIKVVTIPRLELCGAQLLVRLMTTVRDAFDNTIKQVVFWTDSEIVLHWIHRQPAQLKMYVGNRVQQIRDGSIDLGFEWRHVPTASNPADLASRGVMPADLINARMWWSGPDWLSKSSTHWPVNARQFKLTTTEQHMMASSEERIQINTVFVIQKLQRGPWFKFSTSTAGELLQSYSSIIRLENVIATVLRFIHNVREKCASKNRTPTMRFGPISETERASAQLIIYRLDQQSTFAAEIACCEQNKPLPTTSKLLKLNPFIDGNGVLRLGSRIANADVSFDERFPILLDQNGNIAKLIVRNAHRLLLHGGTQDIIRLVRQKFWIFQCRLLVKRVICECVVCYRHRMQTGQQLMGTLPSSRITPSNTFQNIGIDLCGPFTLKLSTGRCKTTTKGYVCVFVCMVTRAVHLEVVRDLSSQQFIMALRRFCGRRGDQTHIYSDNGTNFVGANNILQPLIGLINAASQNGELNAQLRLTWHFATPAASHQGGIYEAAVKSMKKHFVRVIGEQALTYDELDTIVCQIEGCLNSRPLSPLTDDPTDVTALTPGHFIIGRPLVTLVDQPVDHLPQNRLTRWQLIQQFTQRIWQRWQTDVLQGMVNRPKWFAKQRNFQIGDLVVLTDENLPPTRWKLARIINVFPGSDGLIRNVEIRTAERTYRRPITKIGLLLPSSD